MSEEKNDPSNSGEDKTPGIFSWREMVTQDVEVRKNFYTELFGWSVDSMDMGGGNNYHMFMQGGRPVAGMIKSPKEDVPTWVNYNNVIYDEQEKLFRMWYVSAVKNRTNTGSADGNSLCDQPRRHPLGKTDPEPGRGQRIHREQLPHRRDALVDLHDHRRSERRRGAPLQDDLPGGKRGIALGKISYAPVPGLFRGRAALGASGSRQSRAARHQ